MKVGWKSIPKEMFGTHIPEILIGVLMAWKIVGWLVGLFGMRSNRMRMSKILFLISPKTKEREREKKPGIIWERHRKLREEEEKKNLIRRDSWINQMICIFHKQIMCGEHCSREQYQNFQVMVEQQSEMVVAVEKCYHYNDKKLVKE